MILTIILILLTLHSFIGVLIDSKYVNAQILQMWSGCIILVFFGTMPLLGIILWLLITIGAAIKEVRKQQKRT